MYLLDSFIIVDLVFFRRSYLVTKTLGINYMEQCYDYFQCKKTECPSYTRNPEKQCWETDNTLCNSPQQIVMVKYDKNKCAYCLYYKSRQP